MKSRQTERYTEIVKVLAVLTLLAGCGRAADDDLRLRPVLPQSENTKSAGRGQSRMPASEAVDQGCRPPSSIFGRDSEPGTSIDTPQLTLSYSASDTTYMPGRRITLILEFEPKPRMHIYAPGAEHYTPIDWQMAESKSWMSEPVKVPASHMLSLPTTKEAVPVFDGHVRLVRDVTFSQDTETARGSGPDRCLMIEGSFRYQACDDKECYFPRTLPLKWTFRNSEFEKQRAP